MFKIWFVVNLVLLNILKMALCRNVSELSFTRETNGRRSEVLSRRKRFIIFPEGSSLQLVFCLTYPTIFEIGDIFLWGNTAALAWELPQDPYSPYRHHADPLHRRVDTEDTKIIYYTDYVGRVLFKQPYKRKAIVNPAFAKRSVPAPSKSARLVNAGGKSEKQTEWKFEMDQRQMHANQRKRGFLKGEHMSERAVQFHRSSRAELYEKVEAMLRALGSDGRQCTLKTLCQVGQTQNKAQGSFLEELLRAVFTLPHGREFEKDRHKEYDNAHLATASCDSLYPGCEKLITDPTIPIFSY